MRLKKVLVHDEVKQTVPVRKEVIRLETDPPPDGVESVEDVGDERSQNRGDADTDVRNDSRS